jgi:hypothetical protein
MVHTTDLQYRIEQAGGDARPEHCFEDDIIFRCGEGFPAEDLDLLERHRWIITLQRLQLDLLASQGAKAA